MPGELINGHFTISYLNYVWQYTGFVRIFIISNKKPTTSMNNMNRPPITSPPSNNTSSTPPLNNRRWFEEEAIEHNEIQDNYAEDDNDLYDDFLAGELLEDNHSTEHPNHDVATSIIAVNDPESPSYVVNDALVEGLGNIFPPYRNIIIDCVQSVFRIESPTEWQILLIQALVFPKNAANHRIVCIS